MCFSIKSHEIVKQPLYIHIVETLIDVKGHAKQIPRNNVTNHKLKTRWEINTLNF